MYIQSSEAFKSSYQKLIKVAEKVGFQIYDDKTEYIIMNRREVNSDKVI